MTSIFTDLHCCDAFMGVHVCQNLTKLCTLIMFRLLYTNYTLIKNCLKKSQWGLLWNPSSPMKKPFTMALSVPTYSCRVCQQWEALIALYPGHLSVAKFASVASSLERWSNFFSTQRAGLLTAYSKSGRFSQLERQTHSILTTELRLPVRHGGVGSQKTKMPMLTQLGMLSNKVLLLWPRSLMSSDNIQSTLAGYPF